VGANDGSVLAFTQLLDNGPRNRRYNIVLVAEGYTAAEIPRFRTHCRGFLRKLFWKAPYDTLRCTFNVFALEVSSTASGVDDPPMCGDGTTGTGAMPATYFDATMCGDGRVRRVMNLDAGAVRNRVAGFLPEANAMLMLVNSTLNGGNRGDVAIFTTQPGWEDVALHEFGHVLGLADEYGCYVCNGTDGGRRYDWADAVNKGYGLPDQPNISPDGPRSGLRWGSMVLSTTTVPTPPGSVPAGTVGMFESAKYYDLGMFRPAETCAMRDNTMAFCPVCSSSITSALAPWTPTTTCTVPTATPASVTVDARILRKFRIATGRGGYEVRLDLTTNLPDRPTRRLAWRPGWGQWLTPPADRTVRMFVNERVDTYIYDQHVDVFADIQVEDLDYWQPATMAFMYATATDPVPFRRPVNAANQLFSDYDDPRDVGGPGTASLTIGRIGAGNGFVYVGSQQQYSRLAMRLVLDAGYFGPADDPTWPIQTITWTPTPSQSGGLTAVYDIEYGANGLCWLMNAPGTMVDPAVGFAVRARGTDAIGQDFDVTGRLIPSHLEFRRSISTIELDTIPQWEWPMRVDTPENVLDTVVDGTVVTLVEDDVLRIGDVEIELQDARE
jgi:hypothetical protein